MKAGVSRILSLIPERVVRTQSGVLFQLESANCTHPERFAHVAKFLGWLSPLDALTKDDQRILGLIAPNGRPQTAEGDEGEEPEEAEEKDGWQVEAAPQPEERAVV